MTRLRRALGSVAVVWLCCQVGTAAIVPMTSWGSAADAHEAEECTCGHDAGTMCPMHRHTPTGNTRGDCVMKAAEDTGTAVLTTILGISGLIPESTPSLVAPPASVNVGATDVDVRDERPVPPDPPPPRL